MDKRIVKTRKSIFSAILNIMTKKDAKKISVVELCKEADINKSTFYLHYKNIDECLSSCFNLVLNEAIKGSKSINYYELLNNPEEIITPIIDKLIEEKDCVIKLKQSNFYPKAISDLKKAIIDTISENNNFTIENNYKEIITISFIVSGIVEAVIVPLPYYDKDSLVKTISNLICKNR